MSISKRWAIAGLVALVIAWLALFFEMWWIDGEVMREHTAWHPYLPVAAAVSGIGCFVAAWSRRAV